MAESKVDNFKPKESGMGFKDKQKALDTLKALEGRDVSYQYRAILVYASRAKKSIQMAKDETKISNLKEAQEVFDNWINDYKENHRSKENLLYLSLDTVKAFRPLAKKYGILDDGFYSAYKKTKGDYKELREMNTSDSKTTWDIERNRRLKEIIEKIKSEHIQWYETDVGEFRGLPTKEHALCIQLGYSPDITKIRKLMPQVEEKFEAVSEKEEEEEEENEDEEMELSEELDEEENAASEKLNKSLKRKHRSESSSNSEKEEEEEEEEKGSDDEPRKKIQKKDNNKTDDKKETEKKGENEDKESGLGFKDKQKAIDSIKSLEGRDVAYQYHAINGLIKRAERVITCTKDDEKIKNMREAIQVYENWITDYNVNGRSKENFAYLSLDVIQSFKPLADKYGIEDTGFLKAYEGEEGDYKRLRSVKTTNGKTTWDIERNNNLRGLVDKIKTKHIQWFETDSEYRGLPTLEHTQCIMWGFSHEPAKLKKIIPNLKEKLNSPENK